jgi:ABC-type sugar transport system ATPase subunit
VSHPVLEVRGAQVAYPATRRAARRLALNDLDLTVDAGEILVVVGPSGSGKTTLLRAVAGLQPLDSGTVDIDGVDVTSWPAGRRDVSLVFQDLALLPHLDVAANIGFGERARGTSRAEVGVAVHAAADALGLTGLLHQRVQALSGGERQKVALARALVRRPAVFLMDEPLSQLDPPLRAGAREDLVRLRDRTGAPLVHVTHDPHEALGFGDRIAVVRDGRVVQVGTPEEVYDAPVDTFVAGFVGPLPMNLIPDGPDVLGVRPEHVRLVAAGRRSGLVASVRNSGADAVIEVDTDAGERLAARLPWPDRPVVGAPVALTWSPEHEHRFDPATGARR